MDELHVQALKSGTIMVDGKPVTLAQLKAELTRIKEAKGAVLYYREDAIQEPTEQQQIVFLQIVKAQVPISLSSKPDFSDVIDENGQSHPRK